MPSVIEATSNAVAVVEYAEHNIIGGHLLA